MAMAKLFLGLVLCGDMLLLGVLIAKESLSVLWVDFLNNWVGVLLVVLGYHTYLGLFWAVMELGIFIDRVGNRDSDT